MTERAPFPWHVGIVIFGAHANMEGTEVSMAENKGKIQHPYDKRNPEKIREFYEELGHKGGETRAKELGHEGYEELGHKGGQRVKQLIEEGKKEEEERGQ